MNKCYQLLQNALILSPSSKAVSRLADNKLLCVVRLHETDTNKSYRTSIIDLAGDKDAIELRRELDLGDLTYTFEITGISVNPHHRIWLPLEWWTEEPCVGGTGMTQGEFSQELKYIEDLLNFIEDLASKPTRMSADRILNCVFFVREKLKLMKVAPNPKVE